MGILASLGGAGISSVLKYAAIAAAALVLLYAVRHFIDTRDAAIAGQAVAQVSARANADLAKANADEAARERDARAASDRAADEANQAALAARTAEADLRARLKALAATPGNDAPMSRVLKESYDAW